eukprot:TRINITY_DN3846_c0_g1_i1.p2 TRINITY_DN3846_c0_g1~~TRINITY_DN3846_c0_g1_i1.p2  ORF type:complete len:105 (-),score=40.28 TRINITY_DN3846_c0_g1_i1:75-389(-)
MQRRWDWDLGFVFRREIRVLEERKECHDLEVGFRRGWREKGMYERIRVDTSFGRFGIRVRVSDDAASVVFVLVEAEEEEEEAEEEDNDIWICSRGVTEEGEIDK